MAAIQGLEWTFNTQAENYEKMRPGYVPQLYEDLFSYIPLSPSSTVVEVGIGGGQATLPVLHTGCKLTAVEYGPDLAELCRRKFQAFPGFSAVTARFEEYEYGGEPCDLVYSASAFHWIPEETGYKKVYGMLRSGGAFARFANHPYKDKGREGLHEAIQKVYAIYMPGVPGSCEYSENDAQARAGIAEKYGFVDIGYRLYHRIRSFDAKGYVALLSTYSNHIAMREPVRSQFFAEIERAIDAFGGQITIYDTIDLQLARKP